VNQQYRFRYDVAGNRAFIESIDGQLLPAGAYRIEAVRSAIRDAGERQVLANGIAGPNTTAFLVRLDPDVIDPGNPSDQTTLVIGPEVPGQTLEVAATTELTRDIRITNEGDIVIQGLVAAVAAGKRITVESTKGRVFFQSGGILQAAEVTLNAAGDSQLAINAGTTIRSASVANGSLAIRSTGRVRQTLPSGTFVGGISARSLSVTAQVGAVRLTNPNNAIDEFAASAPAAVKFTNSRGFTVSGSGVSAGSAADIDGEIALTALTGDVTLAGSLRSPGDLSMVTAPGGRVARLPAFSNGTQTLIEEDVTGARVTGGFIVATFTRLVEAAARINVLGPGSMSQIFVAASFPLTGTVSFNRPVAISGRSAGITLSGSATAANGLAFNAGSAGSQVSNLVFANFSGTAVEVNGVQNVAVRGITVANSGTGLLLSGSVTGSTVHGSTFRSIGVGMRLQGAQGVVIGGTATTDRNRIEGATTAGVVAAGMCTNSQIIGTVFAATPRTNVTFSTTGARGLRISDTSISR